MTLTDDQYKQVLKYIDGEMDAVQQQAFENLLLQNTELSDEVEFYKEVRLLSKSVEQKSSEMDLLFSEQKKSNDEPVPQMISQARKKWESQHEAALKLNYGITVTENKNIHEQKQNNYSVRMNAWKWLAAAILGVACISVGWWYFKTAKDNTAVVVQNVGDSVIVNNKKTGSGSKTGSQIISDSSVLRKPVEETITNAQGEKIERLFKDNFKPDAVPPDKEGPLENAFGYYENKQYEKASRDFETVDIGPVTRSIEEDNQKLTAFYVLYYKALSYMAADINFSKAINELKKAIVISPDEAWKAKGQWYLALAYLKNGEAKTAQELLKQVAGNDEAKELKHKSNELSKALNEK